MNPKEENKEPVSLADVLGTLAAAGLLLVGQILSRRRNPLHDEIRKQPQITEDAEFEMLDDKKETKLIEYKPADQQ